MKLTKSLLKTLIKEEVETQRVLQEWIELKDFNPFGGDLSTIGMFRTAGKYYLKLGKMAKNQGLDKARQQFAKDKSEQVEGPLEILSMVPLFGAFPGAALVLLHLMAGDYKKALTALLFAAANIVAVGAVAKGGTYVGGRILANPRVLQKATELLQMIRGAAQRLPGGDRIARGTVALGAMLMTPGGIKAVKDIAQTVGEETMEDYENKNKVIDKEVEKLEAVIKQNPEVQKLTSQAAKRKQGPGAEEVTGGDTPGEMYAGNRKDITTSGGLFKESHTLGDSKVKFTISQLRTLVQEEINKLKEEDDSFSKAGEEIAKKGTEGVFTAKAKKRGMTAQEFARKVLANTDEYDTKTVRQASFAKGAKTVADKK